MKSITVIKSCPNVTVEDVGIFREAYKTPYSSSCLKRAFMLILQYKNPLEASEIMEAVRNHPSSPASLVSCAISLINNNPYEKIEETVSLQDCVPADEAPAGPAGCDLTRSDDEGCVLTRSDDEEQETEPSFAARLDSEDFSQLAAQLRTTIREGKEAVSAMKAVGTSAASSVADLVKTTEMLTITQKAMDEQIKQRVEQLSEIMPDDQLNLSPTPLTSKIEPAFIRRRNQKIAGTRGPS